MTAKKPLNAIYGLYPDPESAQRAVDSLRESTESSDYQGAPLTRRLGDNQIVVVTSEPFDGYEFTQRDHHTPMPWIAVAGAVLGGLGGFWLAAFTETAYPLRTGGMPIIPLWSNGIITYELTMLGAVLATLITLLVTARLPRWNATGAVYDPRVSDGMILIGVTDPPPGDGRSDLERRLREAGAQVVVSDI